MKRFLLISLTLFSLHSWADIYVIAHKQSPINAVSLAELKELYLGNRQHIQNVRVLPLDQDNQEIIRQNFYDQVINIDQSQLISHWSKLIFTGKGQSPKSLLADDSILQFVSANPSTIGYINSNAMNEHVKVIYQAVIN